MVDLNLFVSALGALLAGFAAYYAGYEHKLRIKPSFVSVLSEYSGPEASHILTVINHGGSTVIFNAWLSKHEVMGSDISDLKTGLVVIGSGMKKEIYVSGDFRQSDCNFVRFDTSVGDIFSKIRSR